MDRIAGDAHIITAARALLNEPGRRARVLAVDANLGNDTVRALCLLAKDAGVISWLEPTSVPKAVRAAGGEVLASVDIISPNSVELRALAGALRPGIHEANEEACAQELLQTGVRYVVVTRGEKGAALHRRNQSVFEVPAQKVTVRNTSGAGDTLAGAMIAYIARNGQSEDSLRDALRVGVAAAAKVCAEDTSSASDLGSRRHARL